MMIRLKFFIDFHIILIPTSAEQIVGIVILGVII